MNTDMIAFEAEMKRLRGAYIMDIAPACEMYRAALARVEAAEAETADAINDLKIVTAKLARAERATALLAARVAELEAALAAQGWRPLPPAPQEPTQ